MPHPEYQVVKIQSVIEENSIDATSLRGSTGSAILNEIDQTLLANSATPSSSLKDHEQKELSSSSSIETEKSDFISQPATIMTALQGVKKNIKSVLVVGGTDGSGTRRVVQMLTDIGVTMVSEDPETYDIHADLVGGWPPIVSPVLSVTHSLNYDPERLPDAVKKFMSRSLRSLLDRARADSVKPQSNILAVGGALRKPSGTSAARIEFGFKAPVAMTLTPWWAHLLPQFQLLHVLRDGRDIAFSVNQGPVEKFYANMYGTSDFSTPVPLKAMRLWSDWNSQIYNWAKTRTQKLLDESSQNDDTYFGYMALHSEDLVSLDTAVRFAAIKDLAIFVGSSLTDDELCCLSMKGSEFMGSHDRTLKQKENSESQVTSRYGKWRSHLAGNTALAKDIYRLGSEGLRIFGYEPMRLMADASMTTGTHSYTCALSADQCGFKKPASSQEVGTDAVAVKPEDWTLSGKCETFADIDYFGADLSAFVMDGEDNAACCRQCLATASCKHFTIDTNSRTCYLKFNLASSKRKVGLVSGNVIM
eukprot:gene26983-35688_t